jgi:hypothetical protein
MQEDRSAANDRNGRLLGALDSSGTYASDPSDCSIEAFQASMVKIRKIKSFLTIPDQ